jgi:aromatic ring hydroxylase
MDGAAPAVVKVIERLYSIAGDVATQSYEFRAEDQDSFRHRNWFRSEQTLEDLRKNIERALKFQASFDQFRLFPDSRAN